MSKSHTIERCDKDNLFGHRWFVRIIKGNGRDATLDTWYYTHTYLGARLRIFLNNAREKSEQ